jgi:regulator of sirC expression with transglutaminase-like and TPR domain
VLLKKWTEAGNDLDSAVMLSAADAEAYRMRGHVRLKQNRLPEGWQDVQEAMKLAPTDVNVVVLRGEIREAMRLQGIEDPAGLDAALQPRTRIVGN